ncbi:MAG: DUF192 domain-containing protein [Pseudomonadota bacterium]|nr:DUF192 domain-containing protein [Pseudomonadota bacterium]
MMFDIGNSFQVHVPPPVAQLCKAVPLTAALLLGAACSTNSAAETTGAPETQVQNERHPVSGLEVIDVTVKRGDRDIVFKTELAASREEQARGLMFRTELGDFEGMIFPSEAPALRSFWMKNTPLRLDIIFIGVDGRISNIETAKPYSLESVPSVGEAIAVFEIRGGRAKALGIVPGDKVEWEGM